MLRRRKDVTPIGALEPAPSTQPSSTGPSSIGPLSADEALTGLYAVHWRGLVRLAWLLLHDQQGAEDVVQEAFVAMHRRWPQLRDREKALAYVRACVVNGVRSAQRHERVVRRESTAEAGRADAAGRAVAPSAEAGALSLWDSEAMLAAVGQLPRRQREVLVLRYYADLTEAQISDLLGISAGSVKAHAHRALASLRGRVDSS